MSRPEPNEHAGNDRVAAHRARADRNGLKRVETTVATEDVKLIKGVARTLREDGERAAELRSALRSLLPEGRARTGEELVAFFRTFPRSDADDDDPIEFERDNSPGRTVDFE